MKLNDINESLQDRHGQNLNVCNRCTAARRAYSSTEVESQSENAFDHKLKSLQNKKLVTLFP